MMNSYLEYNNVIPLVAPVDLQSTKTTTAYVNLKGAHRVAFLVLTGVTTPNASTDVIQITVEAATAEGGTEAAVGFSYRKSGIVTANTWGAVTAVGTTGAELVDDEEGIAVWIEIDAATLAANDYSYVRLVFEQNAFTATFTAIVAFVDVRYKMATMASSTASASS